MNLYDSDGDFDPEAAADELRRATQITNPAVAERNVRQIQAAALVDIAESLQALAFAMTPMPAADPDEERAQDPSPDDAPLEPGDRVALRQLVEDGVALDSEELLTVIEVGETEGAQWVTLDDELGHGLTGRVWASQYRRVPADAGDEHAEVEQATGAPCRYCGQPAEAHNGSDAEVGLHPFEAEGAPILDDAQRSTYLEGAVESTDLVDDIDADFTGDEHPAAEDALAALKAREKAAKKGKGKK